MKPLISTARSFSVRALMLGTIAAAALFTANTGVSPAHADTPTLTPGIYTINTLPDTITRATFRVDSNPAGGVYLHTPNGGLYQQWLIERADGPFWFLRNRSTGLLLELVAGDKVQTSGYTGSNDQKWSINPAGNGGYLLTNFATGWNLDGSPSLPPPTVSLTYPTGGGHEKWQIVPVAPDLPDLAVESITGPTSLFNGVSGTYTVIVHASGRDMTSGTDLVIYFSGALTQTDQIISADGFDCAVATPYPTTTSVVRCTGVKLSAGTSSTFTVQARGTKTGQGVVTASANHSRSIDESDYANNLKQLTVTVK